MKVLFKQNQLKGQHKGVKATGTDQGTLIKFFADQELWADLLQRRHNPNGSKVLLSLGFVQVLFNLSRNQPGAQGAAGGARPKKQGSPIPRDGGLAK